MSILTIKNEVVSMKEELYDFVSTLTTEEIIYLLYKDHLNYSLKQQEV